MMEMHLTRSGPVGPAAAPSASFEAWQALVAPGDVFRHPREVLAHPGLSRAEKRAILASWASDACALESAPGLRCLAGCKSEPVPIDAVLAALASLDDRGVPPAAAPPPAAPPIPRPSPRRRPRGFPALRRPARPGGWDDDDPPPCPAAAMPRPRTPPGTAALALCVPA